MSDLKQELLRNLPSVTELLKTETAAAWLREHPQGLVTESVRQALATLRRQILNDGAGRCGAQHITASAVLERASRWLHENAQPRIREAINATGIILHTGLGRAVLSGRVVDSIVPELKGCVNLAVDRESGERVERDELIEPLLCELTGAESATVVNNNAGATLLVLAALAAQREVIVSRGQLIEIGGSFRLPDVMQQSQARLVEVGTTNRTHLKDYEKAIGEATAALMRVHPSNYRVVGFTKEVDLAELVRLAHSRGLLMIDDLGAGALLDLAQFGLPHEPTARESIDAGADVVLFSADKLIGAGQGGIIAGRKDPITRIRNHPLMRALRVDKTCIMTLERTLHLFRDPALLRREHPTYRMASASIAELEARARAFVDTAKSACPNAALVVRPGWAYLGSGSLPEQALPSIVVGATLPGLKPDDLARALRIDDACVFARIEEDQVWFDMRTVTDAQVPAIAAALKRIAAE